MRPDVADLSAVLAWLHDTPVAGAIRDSTSLFPLIESLHVLALTLVVGTIAFVDLRLVGLTHRDRSIADVSSELLPFTWIAFGLAVFTGSAMFITHAPGYAGNLQFQLKMLLLLLAGANMAVFHWIMGPALGAWSEPAAAPWPGRIAGAVSLALWIGIVAFGRWIGFESIR